MYPVKKAWDGLSPRIAMSIGIKANHARKNRSKGGDASVNNTAESNGSIIRRRSIFYISFRSRTDRDHSCPP